MLAVFFKKKYFITILLLIAVFLFIYFILPVSVPLIIAIITALFLDPAVKLIVRKFHRKRSFAVLIVFILFMMVLGISAFFISTKVITEGVNVINNAPKYVNQVNDIWGHFEGNFKNASQDLPKEMVETVSTEMQKYLRALKTSLMAYLNIGKISSFLTYIPTFLVSFLVYLIALFLFLLELPIIKEVFINILPIKRQTKSIL